VSVDVLLRKKCFFLIVSCPVINSCSEKLCWLSKILILEGYSELFLDHHEDNGTRAC
jgi:hypothetical protein